MKQSDLKKERPASNAELLINRIKLNLVRQLSLFERTTVSKLEPNLPLSTFEFSSGHEQFDVWNRPNFIPPYNLSFNPLTSVEWRTKERFFKLTNNFLSANEYSPIINQIHVCLQQFFLDVLAFCSFAVQSRLPLRLIVKPIAHENG